METPWHFPVLACSTEPALFFSYCHLDLSSLPPWLYIPRVQVSSLPKDTPSAAPPEPGAQGKQVPEDIAELTRGQEEKKPRWSNSQGRGFLTDREAEPATDQGRWGWWMKMRKFWSCTQYPLCGAIILDVKGAEEPCKGIGAGNMPGRSRRTALGGSLKGVLRDDPEIPGAEVGKASRPGATWSREAWACERAWGVQRTTGPGRLNGVWQGR